MRSAWEAEREAHTEGRPARRYYRITAPGVKALAEAGVVLSIAAAGRPSAPELAWRAEPCAAGVTAASAAAPLVPYDMRADWLREWRAELAYAARARRRRGQADAGRRAVAHVRRFLHAAWLRWDRWRIEMIWQDLKHAVRALQAQAGIHRRRRC